MSVRSPDVPNQPGVPQLLRAALTLVQDSPLAPMTGDAPSVVTAAAVAAAPQWGIYNSTSSALVLQPTSIVSIEYNEVSQISDYPVEANTTTGAVGGFTAYNKVPTPIEIKVVMTKGGALADRENFILDVQALVRSINLVNIVTPEQTYSNFNATQCDYRRESRGGVSLYTVAVTFREVQAVGAQIFSNTVQPSSAAQQTTGPVQAVVPTQTQLTPTHRTIA